MVVNGLREACTIKLARPVSGARWRHTGLQGDTGHAAHQRGVTFECLACQRPYGLELGHQFVQVARDTTNIALQFVITDIAFDQHDPQPAFGEILHGEKSVGQQVAVLLVPLGETPGCLDQLADRHLVIDQPLVVLTQFTQRVNRPAFDANLVDQHLGIHHQRLGLSGCRTRHLQLGSCRPESISRQVGRRQVAFGFVAVQIAWERLGL